MTTILVARTTAEPSLGDTPLKGSGGADLDRFPLTPVAHALIHAFREGRYPLATYLDWRLIHALVRRLDHQLSMHEVDILAWDDGGSLVCEGCRRTFQPVGTRVVSERSLHQKNPASRLESFGDFDPFLAVGNGNPIERDSFLTLPTVENGAHAGWRVAPYCGTLTLHRGDRRGGCLCRARLSFRMRMDAFCFSREAAISEAARLETARGAFLAARGGDGWPRAAWRTQRARRENGGAFGNDGGRRNRNDH